MPQNKERRQWQRIQDDESAALQAQQATAGGTHAPVLGPPPYGDHGVNILVESAVRAERERCAALVEAFSGALQDGDTRALLGRLAQAVRADPVPPPASPAPADG
ncbi:MAG: hypothetical protein ACXWC6_03460 [Ramlibacter sp.]